MGIFRTILAIAVVVYHSYKIFGLRLCGGQVAVESFYIISGFYMALILNEKYVGEGYYKRFLWSRFYRIFPTYWIVLLLALLLSLIGFWLFNTPYYLARYLQYGTCLSPYTVAYFLIENVLVIGQDWFYFLRIDELCQLEFTKQVLSYKHTAFQYLFLPQSWSISIECLFYIIAPFLVRLQLRNQILIILLGILLKWYFSQFHYLCFDPWTYRFFPFELPFFLAGSVAYQFYKRNWLLNSSKYMGYTLLMISILGILFIEEIPIMDSIKYSIFFVIISLSMPYIFSAFKNSKIDRAIGELSFTLYISHHLVVSILRAYFFKHTQWMSYYGYATLLTSIILACILQFVIVSRIEAFRQKRFS